MSRIAAVVVTYNRCDLLEECISALLKSLVKVDVLVIDNASTDRTFDVVQKFKDEKSIKYFNTGANLGGAGGFNYGIKKAYDLGYDYFWLMDDDVIVLENSLSELMDARKYIGEDFGFLSSLAVWTDGKSCKMNKHIVPDDQNQWNDDKIVCQQGIVRIGRATFVSFLLKREVVKDIGLPIKEYFIWGDDTEYSLRISSKYPCYYVSKSVVVHKMKANQSSSNFADMEDLERIKRTTLSIRNDFCTYKRMGSRRLIKFHSYLARLFLGVLKSQSPYKFNKMITIIAGWNKGLLFNPEIEYVDVE